MAVHADVYGTVARVEGYTRDIVVGGTFGDNTRPTLTDVETFINTVGMYLNNILATAGYTVPVSAVSDPYAHEYLAGVNSAGGAWHVLGAIPGEAWEPVDRGLARSRRQVLEKQVEVAVELIQKGGLFATKSDSLLDRLIIGSYQDSDGNTKLPLFTRDVTDYPGSRNLTES
jgi:hypothetical protein